MNEKFKDFSLLITEATNYLRTTLRYHPCTVNRRSRNWRWIKKFMDSKHIKNYNQVVEKKILCKRFGHRNMKLLNNHEKEFHNSIKMMTEFAITGAIKITPRIHRK